MKKLAMIGVTLVGSRRYGYGVGYRGYGVSRIGYGGYRAGHIGAGYGRTIGYGGYRAGYARVGYGGVARANGRFR